MFSNKNSTDTYWFDKAECMLTNFIKLIRLYNNGYITFYSFPIIFDKVHKIEKLIIIFATLINDIDYYLKLYQNQSIKFIDLFSYHIKSKACRNAVKFNDELEREFINELMQSLSLCNNPFLCAHGRHHFYLLKIQHGE